MVRVFRLRRGASEKAAAEGEVAAALRASTARTRRGGLGRLRGLLRGGALTPELWAELEEVLIGADLGVRTALGLLERVRQRAEREGLRESGALRGLLGAELVGLLERPAARGQLWGLGAGAEAPAAPQVILVVGVNGSGKTTSIAKLAWAYQAEGRSVILGAADTFRAAAVEQLEVWADRLGAPLVAQRAGADPGAVAYDTVEAARARGIDVAIIDTAGRLQTQRNLMAELGKIRRVLAGRREGAPHEVLLVLDASLGQNGLSQARLFGEAAAVTAIFLAKLDGSSKGGVVLAIAEELGVPVRFVGTGEGEGDIAPFEAGPFVAALLGEGEAAGGG